MAEEKSWRSHRARLAAIRRHYPNDPQLGQAEQYALKVRRMEDLMGKLLAEVDDLPAEERLRLAQRIHPGGEYATG